MRVSGPGKRSILVVTMAVQLGLLVVACTSSPPAPGPRSRPPVTGQALTGARRCPGTPGFTCSVLRVPLDRSGAVAGTLGLRVAVAGNASAPHGTLLFLSGGPGQPGVPFTGLVRKALPAVVRGYRLVMIDQRGTGGGSLDCPDLQRQMGESDTFPPTPGAVRSCARSLGRERDFFTTADTVADLDALRQALHLRSWTIDGVSYGTFVAEQYALTYPSLVRRLVLDSVVPQQGVAPLYLAAMHRSAFVLRQACRQQRCGYDPAAELAQVIARYGLAARIFDILVILTVIDPRLTDPSIPFLSSLHQAAGGNPVPLTNLVMGFYGSNVVRPQIYSSGLHAATLCADMRGMPWGDAGTPLTGRPAALRLAIAQIPASATWPFPPSTAGEQGVVAECRHWPPARPDSVPPYRKLTMPVLLLAGGLDLSTPLPWAEQEAAQIPHATLVVIGDSGHSPQLTTRQGAAAAERFLLAL
jgi:pimeloyl-ACP methyl ester carboxylesterase